MKRIWSSVLLIVLSYPALAERFRGKVDSIDVAGKAATPHLIKLDTGRVIFLDGEDKDELPLFERSMRQEDTLEVEVDSKYGLESVQVIAPEAAAEKEVKASAPLMSYEPTVIDGLSAAQTIFNKMRRNYQGESQCYNRAHVWAYEEFRRSGLRSMKLFMFFTNRYIRNYRYKWWFHVTPMVNVSEDGMTVERTMDRAFTSGPRYINTWTKNFIYSGRTCPKVYKYNDYRQHQEEEDCYLIPVTMYFWQPRDIQKRDNTGNEKTQFIKSEVDWAYYEAF